MGIRIMYTIQYEAVDGSHKLQTFDSNSRTKLIAHLAHFDRPIMAVYEQGTPITKRAKEDLRTWKGSINRNARDFIFTTRV
jgi:hypothetical protein